MKLASVAIVALVVAAPISSSAQLGATAKPPAGQAATSSIAVPPSVAFEQLSTGGRRMTVTVSAPTANAALGRPADVRQVVLKSETWYCERSSNVSTGTFAGKVRQLLQDYLSGDTVQTAQVFRKARDHANGTDLDAFAAEALSSDSRVKASKTEAYPGGQGPAELGFNDCYTAQEMQAIKAEVARVLGPN